MTKLEKVIKGLVNCASSDYNCDVCEWNDEEAGVCFTMMARDALELLKEQESVKPVTIFRHGNLWASLDYMCPVCHHELFKGRSIFCEHCGKEIKWDE